MRLRSECPPKPIRHETLAKADIPNSIIIESDKVGILVDEFLDGLARCHRHPHVRRWIPTRLVFRAWHAVENRVMIHARQDVAPVPGQELTIELKWTSLHLSASEGDVQKKLLYFGAESILIHSIERDRQNRVFLAVSSVRAQGRST